MPITSDFTDIEDNTYWQHIITSPLKRCKDYAQHVSQRHDLPLHIEPGLQEVSFGEWDGVALKTIQEQSPEAFDNYWRNPTAFPPPQGEPFVDFCQRTVSALTRCIEQFRGQHVLMVTHGGVIRSLLNHVLNGDALSFMRFEVPYACISRIRVYHDVEQDFLQLYFHNR